MAGQLHYLWRAVDHEGEVLESFVIKTRDKAAALKSIKAAMKRFRQSRGHRHRPPALLRHGDERDRQRRAPGDGAPSEQPG